MEKGAEDLIQNLIEQRIKFLFKNFLEEMERVRFDHQQMMVKVKEKTSDDFCKNIDHFSAEKFKDTRKRILDSGNDCLREISDLIQCFDWNLNQEKLEEITKTRKIVKKTIFSPAVFIYEK
jgi:hypothetical protein